MSLWQSARSPAAAFPLAGLAAVFTPRCRRVDAGHGADGATATSATTAPLLPLSPTVLAVTRTQREIIGTRAGHCGKYDQWTGVHCSRMHRRSFHTHAPRLSGNGGGGGKKETDDGGGYYLQNQMQLPQQLPTGDLGVPKQAADWSEHAYKDGQFASREAAVDFVNQLDKHSARRLGTALLLQQGGPTPEMDAFFSAMDKDHNDVITREEFNDYLANPSATGSAPGSEKDGSAVAARNPIPNPNPIQLGRLFIRGAIPMVGFGFVDNVIMISMGDAIDMTLGATFGISTLAAAGLGNMCSDVAGLGMSETIERWAGKFGMKSPNLTHSQMGLPIVQRIMLLASVIGIAFGCLLGMIPLLFLDTKQMKHGEIVEVFEKHDFDDSHFITLSSAIDQVRVFGEHVIDEDKLRESLISLGKSADDTFSLKEFEQVVHHATEGH